VVYGAKVKVTDGGRWRWARLWWSGSLHVCHPHRNWGTAQFKDLQEGITLNEEVDEVTGLSRHVVTDSPDESVSRRLW